MILVGMLTFFPSLVAVKGKVHPRTGHEGPEGEKSYSSALSLTSTTGFDPACSDSLSRLSYTAPLTRYGMEIILQTVFE